MAKGSLEDELMTFGASLKKARDEAGLTQAELAKLLNVRFFSITRYESGHHAPARIIREAIKSFFKKKGISFSYDVRRVDTQVSLI